MNDNIENGLAIHIINQKWRIIANILQQVFAKAPPRNWWILPACPCGSSTSFLVRPALFG